MLLSCLPGCDVPVQLQEQIMHQEATERGLPANKCPKECFPDRASCAGSLLWLWTRSPGQLLGWRGATRTWNRYVENQQSSRRRKQKHGANDLLWFFFSLPKTCWTGCAFETNRDLFVSTAKYVNTVTVSDCIPIANLLHTDQFGWLMTRLVNSLLFQKNPQSWVSGVSSAPRGLDCVFICFSPFSFFDGVVGLVDPEEFIPPSFCMDAKLEMQEPVHFYHLFG